MKKRTTKKERADQVSRVVDLVKSGGHDGFLYGTEIDGAIGEKADMQTRYHVIKSANDKLKADNIAMVYDRSKRRYHIVDAAAVMPDGALVGNMKWKGSCGRPSIGETVMFSNYLKTMTALLVVQSDMAKKLTADMEEHLGRMVAPVNLGAAALSEIELRSVRELLLSYMSFSKWCDQCKKSKSGGYVLKDSCVEESDRLPSISAAIDAIDRALGVENKTPSAKCKQSEEKGKS